MAPTFETIVAIFEYALILGGLGFLGWLAFRPGGRAVLARGVVLPRWDVSVIDFLVLVWLVAALGLATQFLLRLAIGRILARQPDADTLELVVYGTMFHVGAILTWFLGRAYVRRRNAGSGPPAASPAPASRGRDGALTFLAAMPLVTAASLAWEPLLKLAGLPVVRQELVDRFLDVRSPVALGAMMLVALVVAPVGEEIAFRAGLFRFLRARTPRWVALAASAGLFALIHANWVSFLPLFVLGLMFALAYEMTGMIAVPIVAHALFNLNSLLMVLGGGGR
jgi:CAAX protease family protein